MILITLTNCQKKDMSPTTNPAEMVSFKFNVSAFTIKDATFKGLSDDSIFNTFKYWYPFNSDSVIFTAKDGTVYHPLTGNWYQSIDQESFTLPIGEYTLSGNSGSRDIYGQDMSFELLSQKITITADTKTVPITLTPTCYLILVADPYYVIDWSGDHPTGLMKLMTPGNVLWVASMRDGYRNTNLTYLYNWEGWMEDNALVFYRKDGTRIKIDVTAFQWGHIYKIFVNKPITAVFTPGFQADSVRYY